MSAIKPILESIGLNPKEIDIYTLLLQTGGSSASALARRMKIPTSTAQYTCQQLLKKGLIRMIQKGNMYLFGAENPKKLMELVDRQEEELKSKRSSLERIVEQLEGMANPDSSMPKVKFFEGREGIAEAYKELMQDLVPGTDVICYVKPPDLTTDPQQIKALHDKIVADFVAKKTRSRILMPLNAANLTRLKDEKKKLEEHRFIPEELFACEPTEVVLYKDKMYCMTMHNSLLFATILQNEGIVGMQRALFETAWKNARKS